MPRAASLRRPGVARGALALRPELRLRLPEALLIVEVAAYDEERRAHRGGVRDSVVRQAVRHRVLGELEQVDAPAAARQQRELQLAVQLRAVLDALLDRHGVRLGHDGQDRHELHAHSHRSVQQMCSVNTHGCLTMHSMYAGLLRPSHGTHTHSG